MMSLWDALRMNMMISYQELVRTFPSTMGIRPDKLTSFEQFQLSNCLLDNRFNIRVVAFHLRDLIMLSSPGKDTAHLTDEQIIIIGSRYNRGTQREIQNITDSISAPVGTKQR